MSRRWTLALLVTVVLLSARSASASPDDESVPGQSADTSVHATSFGSLAVVSGGGNGTVHPAATQSDAFCLTCHGESTLGTRLADGSTLSLHVDARALRDSAHDMMGCLTCHVDRETCPDQPIPASGLAGYRARAVELCLRCHLAAAGDYSVSVHGMPVLSSTGDGATCNDCHSTDGSGHSTNRVADLRGARTAGSVAESCGRCHGDALATYRRTAHGELAQVAGKRRAAICADCHGIHSVKRVDDPVGGVTPANLAGVCGECHRDADEQFAARWLGHEASATPSGLADYVHWGVVSLMAVGVCFGLTHTTLDFLRNPRRIGGKPK